jgi:predicted kinase
VGERLGAEGYTEAVTRDVYRAIEMRAADLLALDWSVIVDATFLDPASRTGIAAVAARAGVAFDGIWLEATPDAMADRVRHRTHDASDATEEVLRQQLDRDIGAIEWQVVPAGTTAAAVSASVDAALQQHRLPQDA